MQEIETKKTIIIIHGVSRCFIPGFCGHGVKFDYF